MRPKKLTLSAWGPYRDKQEIDFEKIASKGIFLITGATGAGKTTIFDAITYALYGALSGDERDKERSSVRSDFAEPQTPTFVELIMEHAGKEYRILRNPEYMRPKKRGGSVTGDGMAKISFTKEKDNAILYYPDGKVLEGTREVNAALRELLVLDYQQFKKISMIAQGEFARLLVAPPKEKTKIFREIFGTGIYEKFTAGLGVRARHLYAKVMEQKHKLEEDIRHLTVGMEKSVWNEETRQELNAFVQSEYWNYEELGGLLVRMETEAREASLKLKEDYSKADKEVERLATNISKEEEQQRRQLQLQKVAEEKELLKQQEPGMKAKEKALQSAVNAGFVESAELRCLQVEEQLGEGRISIKTVREEQNSLLREAEKLAEITKRADKLRRLLEQAKHLQETAENRKQLEQQLSEKEGLLKEEQQRYLVQEEIYNGLKKEYEEADHQYKLSAIGLVAALLEEGKPCPVCGSVTHPVPAKADETAVSRETLKKLKNRMEKEQKELQCLHENAVATKTLRDSLQQQTLQAAKECAEMEQLLAAETDKICKEYIAMPVSEAMQKLTLQCERAGAVTELLQEKKRQEQQLQTQQSDLEARLQEASEKYQEALKQYGFAREAAYRKAKLSREVRESMQAEVEDYRKRVSANKELYEHLKFTVKQQKAVDLEVLQAKLAEVKDRKEAALKMQKSWEHAHGEVKKTRGLMKDKLEAIGEASAEYGYVKDLENMATGNNSRRLVFEQYVLASYFEEILKAANLRFRKMTSGRYEMSRVGQVGDGRVKDYLEIQVMDYYTGKYRSVRTLSGGESFKASLSLALGMSDVIQSMNGGIRVDTLFVDEGFGALDEESLDQACNTLMSLVEKDCMIGIISHVQELRERISQQLIIEKTNSGSLVRSSVK